MFIRKVTLFRLLGFRVQADASWLFLVILITWSLAVGLFPQFYEDLSTTTHWVMAFVGALGLFACIILHELGHSLVARKCGLPIKNITLFLFGGVAEMEDEPANAKCELSMAVAGPATSLILSALFLGAYFVLSRLQTPAPVQGVVGYLAWINAILALFNLVPAFPLDGGRILRALLWAWKGNLRWATRIASEIGGGFGFVLIFLGVISFISGNLIGGLWWFMIGMFLRSASNLSYRQLLVRRVLQGEPVRKFMKTEPVTVPQNTSVRDLVENYIYKYHFKMYPVVDDGKVTGCVTTRQVKDLPKEEWDQCPVRDIMSNCADENSVTPDEDAMDALTRMNKSGNSRLLVMDGQELAGVLSLKDLLGFLSLKLELQEEEKTV